jgi:hypothetical protein
MLRRVSLLVCIFGLMALVVACSGPSTSTSTSPSAAETKVAELQTTVTALQTKVDAATQADTALKTELTNQTNLVKQLTTRVTTLETSLQNHINPPLALGIKSLTTPVLQGDTVRLVVTTDPGARCSVSVKYPRRSDPAKRTHGQDGRPQRGSRLDVEGCEDPSRRLLRRPGVCRVRGQVGVAEHEPCRDRPGSGPGQARDEVV